MHPLDPDKSLTQYRLDIWNVERGFPATGVNCLYQTKDGYLWAGTKSGLVRYDGYRFKLIKQTENKKIRALLEDSEGTLWIGFENAGLAAYKNGRYSLIPPLKNRPLKNIRSLGQAGKSTLWIGTRRDGAIRFSGENFTVFTTEDGFSNDSIYCIYPDSSGDTWFGTGNGLTVQKRSGEIAKLFPANQREKLDVYSIYDTGDSFWLATDSGFFMMKNNRISPHPLHYKYENLFKRGLPNLLMGSNRGLWFSTDGLGLCRILKGEISILSTSDGLRDGHVYSMLEDREGNFWFGTLQGGLHRLSNIRFTNFTVREGLTNSVIRNIHQSGDGTLWIATQGGLNRLLPGAGKPELAYGTIKKLGKNLIHAVLADRKGYLWVAPDSGLCRYKNNKLETFSTADGLWDNYVYNIFEARNGDLWFCTQKGLNRARTKKGNNGVVFEKIRLPVGIPRKIAQSGDGTLWITTDTGLLRHKNGEFTLYDAENGLMSNDLLCIHVDDRDVVYVGCPSGLSRLENGRIKNFTSFDGLFPGHVNYILEDEYQRLWLSGRNGICMVKKNELTNLAGGASGKLKTVIYNVKDGLKSPLFRSAGLKCKDGSLWFSALFGLTTLNPSNFGNAVNSSPPPVVIEEFRVDGRPVFPGGKNITSLAPGSTRLEFYYTAISFLDSRKIRFKIKMDGYDRDWIDGGNNRTTTYTGLPPGKYTFKVIACNSEGVWNNEGASFSFYLEPYFFQTIWFYIGAGLFLLLSVLVIHRVRLRNLIASERKLTWLVEQRTKALNQRTKELEKTHENLKESKQIIVEKNQHILGSISYARRIQLALLPTPEAIQEAFNEHFVMFMPKDIISGDFYWFRKINGNYYLALGDCTGHGVPGAMLSMIGLIALNDIVKLPAVPSPNEMLAILHLRVREALKQEIDKNNDSIEIALCEIDLVNRKLTFAGAKRPLYYIQNGKFNQIKGHHRPVGGRQKEDERVYVNHIVNIDSPTTVYLVSDGFADQNCKKNKKYGTPRFKAFLLSLSQLNMQMQKTILQEELQFFQSGEAQRDDITVIGLKL